MHSVIAPRDGRHAYVASLGDDLIAQYELDAAGHLPAGPAPRGGSGGGQGTSCCPDERSLYL